MKILVLCFSLLLSSASLYSQPVSLQGKVADSRTKEFLSNANVMIQNVTTSRTNGTATDNNGKFIFPRLRPGKYKLEISYIGYTTFLKEIEIINHSVDLEVIYISQSQVETEQVEVIDKLIPAIQKQDTTEYTAGAFKTNKDASAEELVNKIPGVTNQDGKIQVQGEEVKNVLVDGRVFFGNDPSAVLRNLPAEVVEKIQVFDKQSEQSEFTGFDDGNTSKTLNVITRLRNREGTFGRGTAGYGNERKYLTGANINFFKGDQRITILGQLNNINEQNFSSEDLVGVMAEGGGGRRGNFRSPRGGGGQEAGIGNFRGNDASGFLVNTKDGVTKTGAFGLNYSDKWNDNLELTGSYFYNSADNNSLASLNRDYFVASGFNQVYTESYISNSMNQNHRANLRINYKLDSLNSFLFMPRASFQFNDGSTLNTGNTVSGDFLLNQIANLYNSDLRALDVSGQLLYRRRFETKGRTISLNLNGSDTRNKGDNKLFSESIYYNESLFSDTLDQIANTIKNGNVYSANLMYTEPLGENSQLMLNTNLSYTRESNSRRTYNQLEFGRIFTGTDTVFYALTDTLLSNDYKKDYTVLNFGTGYRYQSSEISLVANLSFNRSLLEKEQGFPTRINDDKQFFSVLSSLMIRYNISRDENLRFHYRTYNREPSVEQLQSMLDNSNPQQLSIGNPDLVQDYRHMLNLRYSSINPASLHSLFLLLSSTFAQDYIGHNTFTAGRDTLHYQHITINPGVQLRTPGNFDGYFTLRSMLAYGLPVSWLKSNLNINLNLGYSGTPAVINNQMNKAKNSTIGAGFVLGSNFSSEMDFTISTNGNYSIIKNTVQKNNNNEYYNQRSRLKFFAVIWEGFFIQTDFNHQYDGGLSKEYDPNSYLLNLSIGKKLFSKDEGEIRFTAFDVFNKSSNIKRTVTDTYWEDTSTNVIGSYFILSFTYNLRAF